MKKNIIEVHIDKKDDYINKFHDNKICPELSEYIYNELKAVSLRKNIEIHIITNIMNEEEKEKFVTMLRENYILDIKEECTLSEKKNILNLFCILIGIVFLFLSILSKGIFVISEVLLIFGWVPIWEAMYNMLFGGLNARIMVKRLRILTKCEIIFKEKNSF